MNIFVLDNDQVRVLSGLGSLWIITFGIVIMLWHCVPNIHIDMAEWVLTNEVTNV